MAGEIAIDPDIADLPLRVFEMAVGGGEFRDLQPAIAVAGLCWAYQARSTGSGTEPMLSSARARRVD
ncbi:MAG: hypothetical protein WDN69_23290 [Aliidongia sp.]